jgi:hypothetical protein
MRPDNRYNRGKTLGDLMRAKPKEKPAAPPPNVVNLMDALRRSLEAGDGKGKPSAKPAPAKPAARPIRTSREHTMAIEPFGKILHQPRHRATGHVKPSRSSCCQTSRTP